MDRASIPQDPKHYIIQNIQKMPISTSITLLLLSLILLALTAAQPQSQIISKLKTDKRYTDSSLNPKDIYAIDIQRIATSHQDQSSKCTVQSKQIRAANQYQKFRVGSSQKREESVYEALTKLPDRDDGINAFKILGEKVMLLMMNGSAYFLNNNRQTDANPKAVDTKVSVMVGNYRFSPLIAPINGNAYVATPRELSFCQAKLNSCNKIDGYKGVDSLFNFLAYEFKGKQYLFFLTGSTLVTYEMSTNGVAFNQRTFKSEFFNRNRVFLEQLIPIPGDKLLLLDFYTGLIELQHSSTSLADITKVNGYAYEQYGCRHLSSQKKGEYIAMQCSLTQKTYFVLQLVRDATSGKYGAQQPIFFNEVLTGIGASTDIIMANIFSGVRLYWTSVDLQSPYPYDFQKAGAIFLHNAKGSQLWTLNDRKVIFIYTEDELRVYDLEIKSPQVVCYSLVPIKEEYKLTYTYLCEKQSLIHLKVCTAQKKLSYEAWQHKQVGIFSTILPLLVSSVLVLAVGILLFKLYKKYDQQIQTAKLKYNSQQQFGIGDN